MKSSPDMYSKVLSIAVLLCVPAIIRCGSDSDSGGTSGAAGAEVGAGYGGLAHGSHAGSGHAGSGHAGSGHAGSGHAGSGHAGSGHAGSAGESTSGGSNAAGAGCDTSAGTGGVNAGTGGVSAGTGGVNAGTGGVNAGTGGVSAGDGGVSAGTGGVNAGTGGVNAGTGGVSAGAGGVSAGTGGVSAGTGGVSAGTGGVSAGTGGVSAGTGGVSAGTGGVSAGTGGVSAAGAGPGILNVSIDSLSMLGQCVSPSQTFTVSNTGQSALTWSAAVSNPELVAVAPSSSTLLPGTEITVTLSSGKPVQLPIFQTTNVVVTITSDVAAQPPASISIAYGVIGTWIGVQPDIDVGEVPLGQSKIVSVPVPSPFVELALGSSNSAFSVPNALAHGAGHWTMIFTPSVLGPQSTNLTIIVPPFSSSGPACPSPNNFTARGVG